MMTTNRVATFITLLLWMAILESQPARAARREPAYADSSVVHIEEMVVSGQAAAPPVTGSTEVSTPAVTVQDPGSLADLGGLLPSAMVAVNSRGDSHLMIRGAPERHVQAFLDGIPLNLPWDERVDLETIPITGVGRLEGRRGLPSLLDGPGVLAGSVRILPPVQNGRKQKIQLGAAGGTDGYGRANLTFQRRSGKWNWLGAGGWQGRDSFPLPGSDHSRFNSDLSQFSLLFRASRPVATAGKVNLLATAWGGEKGVPPETHLGDEARFWRYPLRRRALLGGSLALPLGDGDWDLSGMLAADFYKQEIDPRGPDGWDDPLVAGEDYETDHDRTGHMSAGLTRWLGPVGRLSLQTNLRYTNHTESLVFDGPENSYSQFLGALVLEGEYRWIDGWKIRAGVGVDHAATPDSGDKSQADDFTAPALNLRLARELHSSTELYGSASRRSRFPSLRELYSGALGKFVPNPDLDPEDQNLFEVGVTARGPGWQLAGAAFWQYLHNGIEKQSVPDSENQFMRVNRTSIRVPGLEVSGGLQVKPVLNVYGQYTLMSARVETTTGYDQPAEDRPDYLARLGINWQEFNGPGALLEAVLTGVRWSADTTDPVDGLTRLPAGVSWNFRVSWRWELSLGAEGNPRDLEAHLRFNNLFDQAAYYQVGLPEPGRVISGGLSGRF